MKILSTKQLDDTLIAKINENDIELTCIDMIDTKPLDFDLSVLSISRFDTVVFTSANAVRFFFKNARNKEAVASCHIYATSGRTNNELQQHGVYVEAVASGSAELADIILSDKKVKSVLHICGDLHLNTLGAKLKESDIPYMPLIVYHTERLYPEVRGTYDAILFFSPSGVDSYMKNNKPDPQVLCCCIGSTTGAHLRGLMADAKIVVAETPEPAEMINAIIQYRE